MTRYRIIEKWISERRTTYFVQQRSMGLWFNVWRFGQPTLEEAEQLLRDCVARERPPRIVAVARL